MIRLVIFSRELLRTVIFSPYLFCFIAEGHWCVGGTRTPTGVTPPDPKSVLEKAKSLGNIRNNNHLIGFSANPKTERLGRIRNRSGRHMGDIFRTNHLNRKQNGNMVERE
jgi:hypothetical protein